MQQALMALIATPQNNFKLFLDGKPVDMSDQRLQPDAAVAAIKEAFGLSGGSVAPVHAVNLLASILRDILLKEGGTCCEHAWRYGNMLLQCLCVRLEPCMSV